MWNDNNGLSSSHIFEKLSSKEAANPPLCKSTSFLSRWVTMLPAGVWLITILYTCAYGGVFLFVLFGFLNKIKNVHVAHIINPQYCLTELCVFTQLLTPGIPSWEGDNSSERTILWISKKYKDWISLKKKVRVFYSTVLPAEAVAVHTLASGEISVSGILLKVTTVFGT